MFYLAFVQGYNVPFRKHVYLTKNLLLKSNGRASLHGFQIWGGTRPVASAAGVDCLTQRRRERRGGELRQVSPFPPQAAGEAS